MTDQYQLAVFVTTYLARQKAHSMKRKTEYETHLYAAK